MHPSPLFSPRRPWALLAAGLLFGAACFIAGRQSSTWRAAPPAGPARTSERAPGAARAARSQAALSGRSMAAGWDRTSWQALKSRPATEARNAGLAGLLEALAASDPSAALALAQAENNRLLRDQFLHAVLRGWARTAPDDAAHWALALPDPSLREAALQSVLAGAAAGSPDAAIRTGQALIAQNPGEAVGYGSHLIDALCAAGDFDAAAAVAGAGSDGQRPFWLGEAYSKWASQDPTAAAEAASAVGDPAARTLALHGVIGGWSEADPAGAVQFATQLPDGADKSGLISQALQRWTRVDIKAASEWINGHELGAAMDQGVSSVATQDYLRPEVAATWAESVADPQLRSQTLVTVLRNWATQDLPAAQRYFQSSGQLLPEDRQEVAGVISTLGGASP
jgi:hypothetical protein